MTNQDLRNIFTLLLNALANVGDSSILFRVPPGLPEAVSIQVGGQPTPIQITMQPGEALAILRPAS